VWCRGRTIDEADIRGSLIQRGPSKTALLEQPLGNGFNLRGLLADVARPYLERARAETHGNQTKAAELLGFANPQTFRNWARKHGVKA
jgi:DNA-binding protein Fis